MIHDDMAVTDSEPYTTDSSMDTITIPETQLDPIIDPMSIPETQLNVPINDSQALIQTGNMTSTRERHASTVSRIVGPLVRPETRYSQCSVLKYSVAIWILVLLEMVLLWWKERTTIIPVIIKKLHIFDNRVSANIEDDSVQQHNSKTQLHYV